MSPERNTVKNVALCLPEKVDPFDPVVVEVVAGQEGAIVKKAKEIILKAGVVQLPEGREGTPVWLDGSSVTVQAFSSTSGGVAFRTVFERDKEPRHITKDLVGEDGFSSFYIMVEREGKAPIFVYLLNNAKKAVYEKLFADSGGNPDGLASFESDEFVGVGKDELSVLLKAYLNSSPRQDLADEHFGKLTNRRTKVPGSGRVEKIYDV